MILRRRLAAAALSAVVSVGLIACGGGDEEQLGAAGRDIEQLPADLVPQDLLGLKAGQEDMTPSLEGSSGSYVDAVGLYTYRTPDDLLQATLQVSRFGDDARWRERSFRLSLVARVGGTAPRSVRVGDDEVFLTTGTKQQIAVWFRGDHLFILSMRDEYERPRTLLREALEIEP